MQKGRATSLQLVLKKLHVQLYFKIKLEVSLFIIIVQYVCRLDDQESIGFFNNLILWPITPNEIHK